MPRTSPFKKYDGHTRAYSSSASSLRRNSAFAASLFASAAAFLARAHASCSCCSQTIARLYCRRAMRRCAATTLGNPPAPFDCPPRSRPNDHSCALASHRRASKAGWSREAPASPMCGSRATLSSSRSGVSFATMPSACLARLLSNGRCCFGRSTRPSPRHCSRSFSSRRRAKSRQGLFHYIPSTIDRCT